MHASIETALGQEDPKFPKGAILHIYVHAGKKEISFSEYTPTLRSDSNSAEADEEYMRFWAKNMLANKHVRNAGINKVDTDREQFLRGF